jgi:hypothetical protein
MQDRWRQVLHEARRVPNKHILTIQTAISSGQLREMKEAGVTLVVPEKLQNGYPRDVDLPNCLLMHLFKMCWNK